MNVGETDLTLIRVPLRISDLNNNPAAGCVAVGAQLQVSVNGAAWANATGTLVPVDDGGYYYQGVVGNAAVEGVLAVKVEGVPGYRTEIAFQPVAGSSGIIRIPFVVYDGAGELYSTFAPVGAELQFSNNGAALVNTTGTFFNMGSGAYLYAHNVASLPGFIMVRAEKPADIRTALAFGYVDGVSGGMPVVTNIEPPSGQPVRPDTPISFDITAVGGFALIIPTIVLDPFRLAEPVAFDATFEPLYQLAGSARTAITNGFHYTLRRQGGWTTQPTLRIYAVGVDGDVLIL